MNTHWKIFTITTFGESHGPALWVVIDGMPAWFRIDRDQVKYHMRRRKTGQSSLTSTRQEDDENFEVLSGIFEDQTTGHPLTLMVCNSDAKPWHYDNIKDVFRPNHADFTYHMKYGVRDYRWWWRSSARETVARVLAWSIARQLLHHYTWASIVWYTKQVWDIVASAYNPEYIETNPIRSPDPACTDAMIESITSISAQWDSIWWIVECRIVWLPVWIGEPVFDKIKSRLAASMLSIGGVLWFEYGMWFAASKLKGSEYNDPFINDTDCIHTQNNHCGWMLWWISTGEDIIFRVALKPTSSIHKTQKSVDINWKEVEFQIWGRHDPCIVPRAVPIIESMAALDCLDLYMMHRAKLLP